MRFIYFIVAGFFFFFAVPLSAHAIIFLPAIVLIPIAQIVAVIIGSFSLPAVGLGVMYHKLFDKPIGRVIGGMLLLVIIIAVAVGIYLKIENPARPLF